MCAQSCLTVTPWTVVHLAPLSIRFPRQEIGVGCHFQLQGISGVSYVGRQILYHCTIWEAPTSNWHLLNYYKPSFLTAGFPADHNGTHWRPPPPGFLLGLVVKTTLREKDWGAVLSSSKPALEAILGPLQFYKNFKISLSVYIQTRSSLQGLYWVYGESVFWNDSWTTLSLLTMNKV